MGVRYIDDRAGIAALCSARHFVVLITKPRFADGRFARMAIHDAAHRLLEIPFFIVDVDSEECQRWLASLDLPIFAFGNKLGTGSILWLSNGHVLEFSSTEQRLKGW